MEEWRKRRRVEVQRWPAVPRAEKRIVRRARGRLASGRTMAACEGFGSDLAASDEGGTHVVSAQLE